MARFQIQCSCPTPLEKNPYTCEAESAEEAQKQFFAVNGISGSDHPIEITQEVSEVVQPGKGRKKNEPQSTTGDQG